MFVRYIVFGEISDVLSKLCVKLYHDMNQRERLVTKYIANH
jgi:hypothetical protein